MNSDTRNPRVESLRRSLRALSPSLRKLEIRRLQRIVERRRATLDTPTNKHQGTNLSRTEIYPPEVRTAISSPLATEIANRWILGWPGKVHKMLKDRTCLELLQSQEQQELRALSNPDNWHLAHLEIAELYGLSLSPPAET